MKLNSIYNKDYLEVMNSFERDSIDLIITDPPYKTISGGKGKKGDGSPSGMLSKNDGKIFKENNIEISDFFEASYRVLKEGTHLYVMTNLLNLKDFMDKGLKAGFKLHNLLIWEKNNVTPNRWYMKNCEYVLFFRKGKAKKINNQSSKTVHKFSNTKDRIHPTQKPVDLMELYIENSSNVGDIVLDPFSGSGSTLIGCINTKRNFIGIELDNDYYHSSKKRVSDAVKCDSLSVSIVMGKSVEDCMDASAI